MQRSVFLKVPKLDSKQLQQLEKLSPLFVFVFALVIRLYYDLCISQERLCSFGDGYFFLKTGQELAKAFTSAASFPDFLTKLTVHTSEVTGSVATFGSGALADRLLLDGPIYTSFLAKVHILTGIVGSTDYAQNSNIFSVANSLVDATSCVLIYVCGRLAFSHKAGLIAALLFSIYPAAILNSRLCYSELFTYFLLLLWTTCALCLYRRSEAGVLVKVSLSFFIGVTSILLVLARSVFAPLPLLALTVLFVPPPSQWKDRINLRSVGYSLAAMIVGGALMMAPWLWFTHQVTGKFVPWVNRAPGYNLFVGNQLYTDGWRTWPAQPGIPNETGDALKSLSANFASDPLRFSGLLLRKESRLWAGVWNDFRHKCFGLSWQAQNVFQDLALLFSLIGLVTAVRAPEAAVRRPAIVFAMFALYHSVYGCFEPVARYAITAMPFVFILAGRCFDRSPSPCRTPSFIALLLFSSVFFCLLNCHFSFIPLCFSILPTDQTLPVAIIDFVLWFAGWLVLCMLVIKQLNDAKWWQAAIVWSSAALMTIITGSSLLFDPARFEWSAELKSANDTAQAEISVSENAGNTSAVAYLLVDLRSEFSTPSVNASINGVVTAPPIPVLQLMDDRDDAAGIYSLQAQAMGVDPRSFRHWWAFPFPTKLISTSSPNKVAVSFQANDGVSSPPIRVFGDYRSTAEESRPKQIPSINKFSWVKGFVTIDRRDPRPYEEIKPKGKIKNCAFHKDKGNNSSDLSSSIGRQFGSYRMFLYLPPNATPSVVETLTTEDQSILFQRKEVRLAAGGDPSTMLINSEPIKIPQGSNSAFYMLTCELQAVKRRAIGGVSVTFKSNDKNVQKEARTGTTWSSPWSPTSLELPDKTWQRFTFFGRIPEDISKQADTTASIMVSPFSADRLFLHHKEALRDTVKVRNVELRYLPHFVPKVLAVDGDRLY